MIIYYLNLFLSCIFWGYFDALFNLTFKLYMFYKDDKMTECDFTKTQKYIGITGVAKFLFLISFIFLLFKYDVYYSLVLLSGFILGAFWASKVNYIEKIIMNNNKNETFVSILKYSFISYCSFFVYVLIV